MNEFKQAIARFKAASLEAQRLAILLGEVLPAAKGIIGGITLQGFPLFGAIDETDDSDLEGLSDSQRIQWVNEADAAAGAQG